MRRLWILAVLASSGGCYNPDDTVLFLVDRPSPSVLLAISYQKASLEEVLKTPEHFNALGVVFTCRYHGPSTFFNPGYTLFTENNHVNFAAWAPDERLWESQGFASDAPLFYVDRRLAKLIKRYEALKPFDLIEVEALVNAPFGDRPYFRVDSIRCKSGEPISLQALQAAHRALAASTQGSWEEGIAAGHAALDADLPEAARPHLHRALGHCLLESGRKEEAYDHLTRAAGTLGQDLELLKWQARSARAMGKGYHGAALGFLEEAFRKSPADAELALLLAVAYREAGRLSEALPVAVKAVGMSPRTPAPLELKARILTDLARPSEAAEVYQAVLRLDPTLWDAWIALAKTQVSLGQMPQALASFEQAQAPALAMGGDNLTPDDRYLAARTAQSQGEYAKARTWTLEALKRPGWEGAADARATLGEIALSEGDAAAAAAAYEEALKLRPKDAEFLACLGLARLRAGDAAGAREAFEASLSRRTARPGAVGEGLARACLAQGDLNAAAKAISRAADREETAERRFLQGEIARFRGKPEEAEQAFARVLALVPDDAAASLNQGVVLSEMGRYEEAEALLRASAARQPENPFLMTTLAFVTLKAGKPVADALPLAEKAYALIPDSPEAAHTYGWALLLDERPQDALPLLLSATKAGDVPEVHLHLAQAWISLGKREEALPILERLADGKDDIAREARRLLAEPAP